MDNNNNREKGKEEIIGKTENKTGKLREIEKKWQKRWEETRIFEVKEDPKKKKFYCLEMYPYPSGSGLHMGHAFNYILGDIFARFKRMLGYNVLYPMGYDSFGLPAENAAIKEGINPKEYTENAIKNFIKQQKTLGLSYDWSRIIETHKPEYYKWDQWIFLKMFEKGLAYKKRAPVNYCPKCETVLANEQIHNGKCWRHTDTEVELKEIEQWFLKITDYAEELYEFIDKLNGWPEEIKTMQKNWIGKSNGIEINFVINGENWPIFTTRPDTLFGVTFMVISAQHPELMKIVTKEQKQKVGKFLESVRSTSAKYVEEVGKEGEFTGSFAINPLTRDNVPVYVGNFVLADYGSGMVMAVPAHDQRDFEFAKKYNLPIKVVIQPKDNELKGKEIDPKKMKEAYIEEGILVNSGNFSGLESKTAIDKISDYIESEKLGKKKVLYKLRDWLVSRQRYWGTPLPIIYCEKCGIVSVPEKDLPVELPDEVKFGEGNPLTTNKNFINTNCPKCGGPAKRETDTMDTFVNSSWYFLRYCDPKNNEKIFDLKKAEYWMPIDQYIGGSEHACMHLIYFRFYTKLLRDIGLVKLDEPTINLFNQGMVCGPDGAVMSKSKGNVVDPLDIIEKYSVDILRFSLVSTASPDKDFIWSDATLEGSSRFVNRIANYFDNVKIEKKTGKDTRKIESKFNKAIKEVSDDIENFRYNFAVIKLRQLFESMEPEESKETIETFCKLLHPFCPHITEEFWHKLGNKTFLAAEKWPLSDESKIDNKFEEQEKAAEDLGDDINNIVRLMKKRGVKITKAFVYTLPNEKESYLPEIELVKRKTNLIIEIYAVNDPDKFDPKNKASKAKPGKPAIYLE